MTINGKLFPITLRLRTCVKGASWMAESTFGTSQSSLSSRVSCSVAESTSGLATIGVPIKRPRPESTSVGVFRLSYFSLDLSYESCLVPSELICIY